MNAITPKPLALVVDDEYLIASEIEAILDDIGFTAEIATTPEQAMAVIHAGGRIDVAVVDVHLGRSGPSTDITRALDTLGVPYVICTGSIAEETDEAFRGATVVTKPFLPQQIVAAIRSKIGGKLEA